MEDFKSTTYYYVVHEFITTFDENPSYAHDEEFTGPDLLKAREAAIEYYRNQEKAILDKGTFYGKKFEGYSDQFKRGEHAAYSISLALVQSYTDEEIEYIIAGADALKEDRVQELEILKGMGYDFDFIIYPG